MQDTKSIKQEQRRHNMSKYEYIRDASGRLIAETRRDGDRESYYDPEGRYLGHTSPNGTRDRTSRLIADKPAGGLLFPKKR